MKDQAQAARDAVLAVRATDRAGLLVRGKDRLTWLNGLVTCDLLKLGPGAGAYGLVVEKKGRIQTDFYGVPSTAGDALALAIPAELRTSVLESLDHYLVMEDAELEAIDLAFWSLTGPKAAEVAVAAAAPYSGTLTMLGTPGAAVAVAASDAAAFAGRLAGLIGAAGGLLADDAGWEAVRIERGIPRFGLEADATLYPQEASLEKLAVSFDKGCYLGQEVIYMLENRGHVKRKLVPLEIDGDAPVAPGAAVTTAEGAAVGEVKSAVVGPESGRSVAIAMLKWSQAKPGTELRVGERVARVRA